MSKPFKPEQTPGIDCCIHCGETQKLREIDLFEGEGCEIYLYCPEHYEKVVMMAKKMVEEWKGTTYYKILPEGTIKRTKNR